MPIFQMIPVDSLIEPLNRQRNETLYEGIDELRNSIRSNGLQQPIGVVALPGGQHRIIWGERRSIAVTQLQWTAIPAMVYEPGEADEDALMGQENYHRTSTNDAEEARYYKRILPKYVEGTIGMARELNVPQSRIEKLLLVLDGDPEVFGALAKGEISVAQAHEINQFAAPGYRLQCLERVRTTGFSANAIKQWRKQLREQGIDQGAAEQQQDWAKPMTPTLNIPQGHCQIGNHDVPLLDRKVVDICFEHYNIFLRGLECLGQIDVITNAGLLPDFMRLLRRAEQELDNGGSGRHEGQAA